MDSIQQARAICESAVPGIFGKAVYSEILDRLVTVAGILNPKQEKALIELIASNLEAAYDNGVDAAQEAYNSAIAENGGEP